MKYRLGAGWVPLRLFSPHFVVLRDRNLSSELLKSGCQTRAQCAHTILFETLPWPSFPRCPGHRPPTGNLDSNATAAPIVPTLRLIKRILAVTGYTDYLHSTPYLGSKTRVTKNPGAGVLVLYLTSRRRLTLSSMYPNQCNASMSKGQESEENMQRHREC